MTVRELIEMLAKQDWNAEVLVDNRINVTPAEWCDTVRTKKVCSISSFTKKGAPIVALNTGR